MTGGVADVSEAPMLVELRKKIVRTTTLVGLPISTLIAVYYSLWGPLEYGSRLSASLSNLVELAIFGTLLYLLGGRRVDRRLARHERWLSSGTVPPMDERRRLATLPLRLAAEMFIAMALISLAVGLGSLVATRTWQDPARAVVGLLLSGTIFAALTFLVAEQSLRPLFARVLVEPTPQSPIGVERRVLVGWMLGSAVPLLFLLAVPVRGGPGRLLPLTVPLTFMAITGLVIGGITTTIVARSIAVPLRSVRAGLKAVAAGDLDVTITVDDPGDLGDLQRGFNEMVVGVRERRALEDLFGRYVGRDLASQVLTAGPDLNGELRTVTVLFVDLIGSTAWSETRAPEQIVTTMNAFYRAVCDVMDAHGGWIDKFQGDGAMCVFGAPLEQADQADRALAAAIDLCHQLTAIDLPAAIGLTAGEAVAGTVGTSDRFEYTVIGRPVNEAARLTEEAKHRRPPRVLASAAVIDLATKESRRRWRKIGEVQLRGIDRSIQLYRPLAPR